MGAVEKITVSLTPEMASFVRDAVQAGRYASTSEAIREAVREWQERRNLLGFTVEQLRELYQEGIDSGPSPYASVDDVLADAHREFRQRKSR